MTSFDTYGSREAVTSMIFWLRDLRFNPALHGLVVLVAIHDEGSRYLHATEGEDVFAALQTELCATLNANALCFRCSYSLIARVPQALGCEQLAEHGPLRADVAKSIWVAEGECLWCDSLVETKYDVLLTVNGDASKILDENDYEVLHLLGSSLKGVGSLRSGDAYALFSRRLNSSSA